MSHHIDPEDEHGNRTERRRWLALWKMRFPDTVACRRRMAFADHC